MRSSAPKIEVYTGAQHGWCAIDTQAYNKELAEKAWARKLALFSKALAVMQPTSRCAA